MQMRQVESHKIKSPATNLIPVSLPSFLLLFFYFAFTAQHLFVPLPQPPPPDRLCKAAKKKMLNRLKVALSIDRPQQIIHSAGSDHAAASLR